MNANEQIKVLPINEAFTVYNYPYGFLQCEATFAIEFKKGKGFRQLFQTVNPKTGRINKPKMSTYSHFGYLFQDEKEYYHFSGTCISGYKDVIKVAELILTYPELSLTSEMVSDIAAIMFSCVKLNAAWTISDVKEDLKDEFKTFIKTILDSLMVVYKSGNYTHFSLVKIDLEKLESFKIKR